MASKSRWAAPDPEEEALAQRNRLEKEAKKRAKEARQRQLEEARRKAAEAKRRREEEEEEEEEEQRGERQHEEKKDPNGTSASENAKRRKTAAAATATTTKSIEDPETSSLLRFPAPEWRPCRHVDNFESLNRIEEGSYGCVSRAREKTTGTIVALKKLKMDNLPDGCPVTGLREIQTLMESRHENILNLQEVVVGDSIDDVYLVMDFIEHDLKVLLEDMQEPFLPSEMKTIMRQIIAGTEYLHSHWIMHRDLKTSNILMNNGGQIKIADFGMARYFGDPPPQLTRLVVTLWYRAPELLLGEEKYGPEIDIWSIGCIFAELLLKEPLFQARNEADLLKRIFDLTGSPTTQTWPNFRSLPGAKSLRLPPQADIPPNAQRIVAPLLPREKFPSYLSDVGHSLLSALLALNPASRPVAGEALRHPWFSEDPKPKAREIFPSFPSKARLERRRRKPTPEAPRYGEEVPQTDFSGIFNSA